MVKFIDGHYVMLQSDGAGDTGGCVFPGDGSIQR